MLAIAPNLHLDRIPHDLATRIEKVGLAVLSSVNFLINVFWQVLFHGLQVDIDALISLTLLQSTLSLPTLLSTPWM